MPRSLFKWQVELRWSKRCLRIDAFMVGESLRHASLFIGRMVNGAPSLGFSCAASLLPLQRVSLSRMAGGRAPRDVLTAQKTQLAEQGASHFYMQVVSVFRSREGPGSRCRDHAYFHGCRLLPVLFYGVPPPRKKPA